MGKASGVEFQIGDLPPEIDMYITEFLTPLRRVQLDVQALHIYLEQYIQHLRDTFNYR